MDRSGIAQNYLEQEMLEKGVARYASSQTKAHKRQELTSSEEKLFKQEVAKVTEAVQKGLEEAGSGKGRKPSWYEPVEAVGAVQSAVVALRIAFTAVISQTPYTPMCSRIGRQVELEMISRIIETKDVELYKAMLKRAKNSAGLYTLKARQENFLDSARDAGFWSPLPDEELVKIGSGLFNFVLMSTSLFSVEVVNEGVCSDLLIASFTEEAGKKMEKIEEMESWMKPVYRPMVVTPRPWEAVTTGCYLDPKISNTVPLVKTFSRDHLQLVDAAVQARAPFVDALNAIQSVPVRVNAWVLDLVEAAYKAGVKVEGFPQDVLPIPKELSASKKKALRQTNSEIRSEQANFLRDLAEAKEYSGFEKFYQPAQLDWRSRVYAKNHLNHQRSDYCKAMFELAEGKPLTEDGVKWMAIHLATTGAFGKIDKAPLDKRIKWTREHTTRIVKMVQDPLADLWWTEADSPFVFLACCKAWVEFLADPEEYVCHLPVHQDGSCSGLQHFSALLRDSVGGKAVSLVPDEKPADVYQAVADVVLQKALEDDDNEQAQQWMKFGIDRKVAKRCVMTFVYGSKQYGFAEHITADFMDPLTRDVQAGRLEVHPFGEDGGKAAAQYIAKHVWEAVQEVVQAAAKGMAWLQDVAGLLAAENLPVVWTTPTGFPVVNAYYQPKNERIKLFLWERELSIPRRVNATVTTGMTKELRSRKQRSSISPNFIHSLDASHLMKVVIKARQEGIHDFLMVHDSFGCHPSDMERFSQIIRETFVEMYEHHDPLKDLYESAFLQLSEKGRKKLTPPPAKGSLDLKGVLTSHYAFA